LVKTNKNIILSLTRLKKSMYVCYDLISMSLTIWNKNKIDRNTWIRLVNVHRLITPNQAVSCIQIILIHIAYVHILNNISKMRQINKKTITKQWLELFISNSKNKIAYVKIPSICFSNLQIKHLATLHSHSIYIDDQ